MTLDTLGLKPETPLAAVMDSVRLSVERAARKGRTLAVSAEAARLIASFPECPLSANELEDEIVRIAARRGVVVEFG